MIYKCVLHILAEDNVAILFNLFILGFRLGSTLVMLI